MNYATKTAHRFALPALAVVSLLTLAWAQPQHTAPFGTWIVRVIPGQLVHQPNQCVVWTVPNSPNGSLFWAECEDGQ